MAQNYPIMDPRSIKYATVSITAFVCYCNTLWGSFVFDDTEAIVKNKDVMPYTPLQDVFRNDFWGTNISLNSSHKSYRPLTILSYRLNVIYSKNKLDAFQFHATNVILYGILCILTIPVFELFIYVRKKKYDNNVSEVAFLSTLLFTVHPVHTETVAGLVGRADILSSIMFFFIIIFYNNSVKGSFLYCYCGIFILTTIAVLCKETAITALGVCIMYDIYKRKQKKKTWLEVFNIWSLVRYSLIAAIGLIILYYRLRIMNFQGPIFTSIDNPAAYSKRSFTKVFTYSYIYFLNLIIFLWPQWLCFDWSMGCVPLIDDIFDIRIIFVGIFWIITLSSVFVLIKRHLEDNTFDARIMAIILTVLPFLPASNIFFKVGFVIAERNLLLPSAGFCLLVVLGYKKLERRFQNKRVPQCFLYSLYIIFICRSVQRNFNWLTEERLFNSALNVCPLNAKVHYNIAKIAADNNNTVLAMKEYRVAIRLNPNYEQAMNNLANLLRDDKKFDEAEGLLRRALSIRPNFAAAWMNLGIVLINLNKFEEAEHCYKMAIMHRKKYPDCYYNLGNLYLDQGRHEEALKAWEMAVLYRPTHVAAWSNTLVLLDTMKKYNEALDLGRTALIHNPKSPAIHFTLANTLGKIHKFNEAEGHFLEAINLSPNSSLYYSNLGVLYHHWNKTDKAREMYKKALQIDPNMKSAEINLRRFANAQ